MSNFDKSKKLILISLNEINFDIASKYANNYNLKNIKVLLSNKFFNFQSSSEKKYNNLEPWIQWVSVYTGLSADDHGIFRLGDVVSNSTEQIYEKIEKLNFKVGAISPMNASNSLESSSYFIPDPWTQTKSDNSYWSKKITKVLSETVNQNVKNKISLNTFITLLLIFIKFVRLKKYPIFFYLFITSIKKKWRKAIFLDFLINEIHLRYLNKYKPNFSNLFLNSGAHIQHHHFLKSIFFKDLNNLSNTNIDPVYESLYYYDKLIEDYIYDDKYDFIIYTGLSQTPNKNPTYYYRLKNHDEFLEKFNIKFKKVYPRMSRDFLIEFNDLESSRECINILKEIKTSSNENIFNEIDNRGTTVFVSLTYSKLIDRNLIIFFKNKKYFLYNLVDFVAIKNGIHDEKGYFFSSKKIKDYFNPSHNNIKDVHNIIMDYFKH